MRGFLVFCLLNVFGVLLLHAGLVNGQTSYPIPTEIDGVPIPPLRPMSADEAHQLLRYVRELRTNQVLPSRGVAWAAVTSDCTWRSLLKYWAIASSPRTLSAGDRPPLLTMDDLRPEKLLALEAAPTRDVAIIQTAAELATYLTWIYPNGTDVPFTFDAGWKDHYSVVINVEGTIKVVDLSIGDTPIDIQDWFRSFVPARHKYCWNMNATEWFNLWSYWLLGTVGNFYRPDLLTDESRACGYSIVPVHLSKALLSTAAEPKFGMEAGDAFLSFFRSNLPGVPEPEWDMLPYFHVRYNAMTREEICSIFKFVYCPQVEPPQPDPCSSNPCENNGVCQKFFTGYMCHCGSDYLGTTCTTPNLCATKTCPPGSECQSSVNANDEYSFDCVSVE